MIEAPADSDGTLLSAVLEQTPLRVGMNVDATIITK